jgi:hypothetical protein
MKVALLAMLLLMVSAITTIRLAPRNLVITIERKVSSPNCQMGYLLVDGSARLYTLELPDGDNAPFVSSIPAGEYPAEINKMHDDNGLHWRLELIGVPNRDRVQIHIGNEAVFRQTKGCILVGKGVDSTQQCRITRSTDALRDLKTMIDDRLDDPVDPPTGVRVVIKDVRD